MIEIPENLFSTIANISNEIEAIKHTFVSTNENQRDSFKPFLILFSDSETKSFVVTSRPVTDEQDYYTAISEMMFSYSANNSKALLFAIDVTNTENDQQQDILEVYAACDEYCTVFRFPYYFSEDNKFHWNESSEDVYTLDKLEKAYDTSGKFHAQLEIFELLFLHTHMDREYFDITKIKSYFDFSGFNYVHLSEESSGKSKTKIKLTAIK